MKTELTDPELVELMKQADPESFEIIWKRYAGRIYPMVSKILCNHEDTEDMMSEVMAKVWQKIQNFKGHSSFYTWVYSVAHNMSLNFRKKRGNMRKHIMEEVDEEKD